ncbi:MAG: hypothetical protein ACUVT6_01270 [Thermodesulfobacteriota bacterium]
MMGVKRGRTFFILIPIFFLTVFSLSMSSAEEEFFKRGKSEGIPFLSGGVGVREREILNEIGKNYSLKIVFFNKKGEYLSDIVVRVLDQREKQILTTVSNGPWLFIDLPSGIYHFEASFRADRKRISQVQVEKGIQKVISFQW